MPLSLWTQEARGVQAAQHKPRRPSFEADSTLTHAWEALAPGFVRRRLVRCASLVLRYWWLLARAPDGETEDSRRAPAAASLALEDAADDCDWGHTRAGGVDSPPQHRRGHFVLADCMRGQQHEETHAEPFSEEARERAELTRTCPDHCGAETRECSATTCGPPPPVDRGAVHGPLGVGTAAAMRRAVDRAVSTARYRLRNLHFPGRGRGDGEDTRVPRDPTWGELARYFARVAMWYTRGGFVDERGVCVAKARPAARRAESSRGGESQSSAESAEGSRG